MSIKDKVFLFAGSVLAGGLAISGILLAKGKMLAMGADGFKANALLATADKDRYVGMGEMLKGLGELVQSTPPLIGWLAILVLAIGLSIAIVRFSFSMSRVHEERNKYIVNSGSLLEKKLLGNGVSVRSLPLPVTGQFHSPDPDGGSLEGDDDSHTDEEPYISPIHAKQRVVSYTKG